MKFLYCLSFMVCVSLFVSCGGEEKTQTPASTTVSTPTPAPAAPAAPNPATFAPAGTAAATQVAHYTCPNKCSGSGGAAQGNCPVCGTAYEHNQAFHNQPAATTTTTATPAATPATPATNASGAFHFKCGKAGCDGGGNAKGPCSKCGTELVHNDAYHK